MPPRANRQWSRGCAGAFVLLIGVPHLAAGLAATLGGGQPLGAIFIGSGALMCTLAGWLFGADWRAALGVVLGVIVAALAVAVALKPQPGG
jgi:hypothetical protein